MNFVKGVVGARLQIRRGSAPTTGPSLGNRGAQDRRSDPTQYYSHECFDSINFNDATIQAQLRRGSVPLDLLRQSIINLIYSKFPNNHKILMFFYSQRYAETKPINQK